jgi:hypothetical protein
LHKTETIVGTRRRRGERRRFVPSEFEKAVTVKIMIFWVVTSVLFGETPTFRSNIVSILRIGK